MRVVINLVEEINTVLNSEELKEYHAACKEIRNYYKANTVETCGASKRYKKALKNYRVLLDTKNFKLPPQKYPIIEKFKNTLKYTDVVTRDNYGKIEYVQMVHNPDWVYRKDKKPIL